MFERKITLYILGMHSILIDTVDEYNCKIDMETTISADTCILITVKQHNFAYIKIG